ncbi:MAG TPA: hypothetical protein VFB62_13225, partial [Polyangiaceae bacterium]|nr:hypothetical protein [Polyangiaceae bacterium]
RYDTAAEFAEALRPFAPAGALEGIVVAGWNSSKQMPTSSAQTPAISGPAPSAQPDAAVQAAAQEMERAPDSMIEDEPDDEEESSGLSSRTILIVSAVSVIAGIVLAVLALKLLG